MICRYCRTPLKNDSKFCSQCSEKTNRNRLTFSNLSESVLDNFLSLDKGIFFTIYNLFKNPTDVVGCYLNGSRKKYHSPLRVYTTILFFSILIFSSSSSFNFDEGGEFKQGFNIGTSSNKNGFTASIETTNKEETSNPKIKDAHIKDFKSAKTQEVFDKLKANVRLILQVSFIVWIPVSALFLMWFFRYRGFNYLENFAVSMYFSAVTLMCLALYAGFDLLFKVQIDDFSSLPLFEVVQLLLYFYLIRSVFHRKGRFFYLRFLGYITSSLIGYSVAMAGLLLIFMYPHL